MLSPPSTFRRFGHEMVGYNFKVMEAVLEETKEIGGSLSPDRKGSLHSIT